MSEQNQEAQEKLSTTHEQIYAKATFVRRWVASLIDLLVLTVGIGILFIIPEIFFTRIYGRSLYESLTYLLLASLLLWKFGATPGKMLLKIKVVHISYRPLSFWRALFRESIGKFISGFFLNAGYFWMLIDPKRQTWHDTLAKTFVVMVDKKGNLIPITEDTPITRENKIVFSLLILFQTALIISTFLLFMYIFMFRPFQISGNTMSPNYLEGEYVITQIRPQTVQRGDVIVFVSPVDRSKNLIKRVVGLPGETVMLKDGKLYIDDVVLDESKYLPQTTNTNGGTFLRNHGIVVIPQDKYFVLGDNRPESIDSREFGLINKSTIIGKVLSCYWNCSK